MVIIIIHEPNCVIMGPVVFGQPSLRHPCMYVIPNRRQRQSGPSDRFHLMLSSSILWAQGYQRPHPSPTPLTPAHTARSTHDASEVNTITRTTTTQLKSQELKLKTVLSISNWPVFVLRKSHKIRKKNKDFSKEFEKKGVPRFENSRWKC